MSSFTQAESMDEMRYFNKKIVLTIQGGGMYGFSLLGQLNAVMRELNAQPLAYAGTSAGAILATLSWAGLTPDQIITQFQSLADKRQLVDLLGPFDTCELPSPWATRRFDFAELRAWLADCSRVWDAIRTPRRAGAYGLLARMLCLRESVNHAFTEARGHAINRGIFNGKGFEVCIDQMIRSADDLVALKDDLPQEGLLTFGDVHNLIKSGKLDRPALFLAATDTKRQDVVLFNSFEQCHAHVPIATAVRASAGFPFFFRPIEIVDANGQKAWYVDGGVISNFPAWVFSDRFREMMDRSDVYGSLAAVPWLHIGLRVTETINSTHEELGEPATFAKSIFNLLTGQARNRLEDLVSQRIGRSVVFLQPKETAGGPSNLLAINEVDSERINIMARKGDDFVSSQLRDNPINFAIPGGDDAATICEELERLVFVTKRLLESEGVGNVRPRSNVFLAEGDMARIAYQFGMDGDPDAEMNFPIFKAGLTGFAFFCRRPFLCNLRAVEDVPGAFGLDEKRQQAVEKSRSWLVSMPIYDPCDTALRVRSDYPTPPYMGHHYMPLESDIDGAVLAVLNVDADIDYDSLGIPADVGQQWTDQRIRSIVHHMQGSAARIGGILSNHFGRRRQGRSTD